MLYYIYENAIFYKKDMVNHTKNFIEKHKRLLEEREEARLKRIALKKEKKKETHKRRLKKLKEKYDNMDIIDKIEYLNYLYEYREERSFKEECERVKAAAIALNGKKYSIYYNKQERPYYITDEGVVYNRSGIILKLHQTLLGYLQVGIDGRNLSVHRLVWESFNGVIPKGYEIDHINGDRQDNRLCNLILTTHKENCNNPITVERYKVHNKTVDRNYLKKNI